MNKPSDYKEDSRPQLYGWVPGGYMQVCCICKDPFIGDKRAVMCADCAYSKDVADFIGEVEEVFYCPECDTPMETNKEDIDKYFSSCPLCGLWFDDGASFFEEAEQCLKEEYEKIKLRRIL